MSVGMLIHTLITFHFKLKNLTCVFIRHQFPEDLVNLHVCNSQENELIIDKS